MSRVHPNCGDEKRCEVLDDGDVRSSFTVWKKSSMSFQGMDGFTVFDQKGGLVFRVDNYSRNENLSDGDGLVLMDGVGNVVLTLRPQGFSLRRRWNAYKGEYRVFTMKRRLRSFLTKNSKDEPVDIFLQGSPRSDPSPDYTVEGSFACRNCIVRRKNDGALVARIARKRVKSTPNVVLANDVFSLVIEPGFDTGLVMGYVLVLDRICRKPASHPVL
ncbi:hypothetical protein MLD38_021552 [Melastoma candidum]|uniref:Uncharacterized protein n=1 Tax=Melastoma candidum TaxID=119954 RepID=A0ACB9QGM6_9MYRT|nr:hypothetical protein MLD38_021552 [Melastoma candidum]